MRRLSAGETLGAGLASIVGGVAMALLWHALLTVPFMFTPGRPGGGWAILVGLVVGYVFMRLLDLTMGRERGTMMVGFAIVGLAVGWAMLMVVNGPRFAVAGLIATGISALFAYPWFRQKGPA